MIFTFVTAFDQQSDIDYLNSLRTMFESSGGEFYFIELSADIKIRLERNVTPHRLASKLSKNDIETSTLDLIESHKKYQLNSKEGQIICPNHLIIDNSNLTPDEASEIIAGFLPKNDTKIM